MVFFLLMVFFLTLMVFFENDNCNTNQNPSQLLCCHFLRTSQ